MVEVWHTQQQGNDTRGYFAKVQDVTQEKYQKVYDVPTELVHNVANVNDAAGTEASGGTGSLLPPLTKLLHRGGKLVSFKLDKWGFKDDVAKVSNNNNRNTLICLPAHDELDMCKASLVPPKQPAMDANRSDVLTFSRVHLQLATR